MGLTSRIQDAPAQAWKERCSPEIALGVLFDELGELHTQEGAPVRWYRDAGNRGPDELHVGWASVDG